MVEDDGSGIEKSKVDSLRSMGIAGMKERVRSVRGKITFRGEPGSGTTLKVTVPLINEKNND
jgi:signal transduction histidine kinase